MRSLFSLWIVVALSAGCGGAEDGPAGTAVTPTPVGADDGSPTRSGRLTVEGGFATQVGVGDEVHLWAHLEPSSQVLVGWRAEPGAGLSPDDWEWHEAFARPAGDVTLRAEIAPLRVELVRTTIADKEVLFASPPEPRGVILFLHGTSGSLDMLRGVEPFALALAAYHRGYALFSMSAYEVDHAETDADGQLRWDVRVDRPENRDVPAIGAVFAGLEDAGLVPTGTPRFALGMSNGGNMSYALATLPELGLRAAAVYCARGGQPLGALLRAPTAWFLCGADPLVDNEQAVKAYEAAAQGPTRVELSVLPPAPLHPGRLRRAGVDVSTALAIVSEFERAELLDADGRFLFGYKALEEIVQNNPARFETLSSLPAALRGPVVDQINIVAGGHAFFSDRARATLDFFDAAL